MAPIDSFHMQTHKFPYIRTAIVYNEYLNKKQLKIRSKIQKKCWENEHINGKLQNEISRKTAGLEKYDIAVVYTVQLPYTNIGDTAGLWYAKSL